MQKETIYLIQIFSVLILFNKVF